MKYFASSCLLLFVFLFGCSPSAKEGDSGQSTDTEAVDQAAAVVLAPEFYKKLKGTIGDIAITMDLVRRDSTLSGKYYYDKVGLPISLNGTISTANAIVLSEYVGQGEETGSFKGSFVSATEMEGNWTNSANHKVLPFKLKETTELAASIDFEHFHQENCATREKNLKHPKPEDEQWMTDTLCSYIDVTTLKAKTGKPAVDAAIAEALLAEISGHGNKTYPTMAAYLNSINDLEEDEFISRDQYCAIICNEAGLLCVDAGGYEFGGGAHGIGWVSYLNFDLQTGRVLQLKDLLVPNYADRLDEVAARIFFSIPENEEMLFEENRDNFKVNDNFAVTPGGLIFTFNPYEIAAYAAGMPEVVIPYKDIEALIPAGGLLARIRHK